MTVKTGKFRVEILATNGDKIIRLLWCEHIKDKGIYASVFDNPWNLHFSYPKDGKVHVKQEIKDESKYFNNEGYLFQTLKGPPLNNFKGSFIFMQGGIAITNETFKNSNEYKLKKLDRVILLDVRRFLKGEADLHYSFDLVEPQNYNEVTKNITNIKNFVGQYYTCEHHCYFELTPWVIIHLSYR